MRHIHIPQSSPSVSPRCPLAERWAVYQRSWARQRRSGDPPRQFCRFLSPAPLVLHCLELSCNTKNNIISFFKAPRFICPSCATAEHLGAGSKKPSEKHRRSGGCLPSSSGRPPSSSCTGRTWTGTREWPGGWTCCPRRGGCSRLRMPGRTPSGSTGCSFPCTHPGKG